LKYDVSTSQLIIIKNTTEGSEEMRQKTKRRLKHKPYLRLKGLLIEQGKTQRDLAKLLSLAAVTINQKINGVLDFTLSEAIIISNYLDKSLDEIFLTS